MSKSEILNIILVVLCAAAYGLSLYFKTKGSATEAASQLIALIENSGRPGSEKMAFVVGQLYEAIPAPLRAVFTMERLQQLAQDVFDEMKKYALEYINRIEKAEKEPAEDAKGEKQDV